MTKAVTVVSFVRGETKVAKVIKPCQHQTIVKMFRGQQFRWTANGLCPVWLVPETHEEAN